MHRKENIKGRIFKTSDSWDPMILRILLGLVVLAHGAQKLLGWFGGYGFTDTMEYFTETMGFPWLLGLGVIVLESLGAVALIVGIFTRVMAIFYIVLAFGIVLTSHIQNGFFMNWFGNQQGEGFEFFIFWVAMATALVISGGGKFSLDRKLQ